MIHNGAASSVTLWRSTILYFLISSSEPKRGEKIIDTINFSQTLETNDDVSDREKIEALADIICGAGDKAAGALFVLMGMLQHSTEPEALAHAAKHFAFTRCGELNLYGMVDAQIAVVEGELLADSSLASS